MDEKLAQGEPKCVRQMTLADFDRLFPDEDSCKRYLMDRRWPTGPRCPRCGNEKLYKAKRAWSWECHKCGPHPYRFSLYVGTVFENTNNPLRTWFKVAVFYADQQEREQCASNSPHDRLGFLPDSSPYVPALAGRHA